MQRAGLVPTRREARMADARDGAHDRARRADSRRAQLLTTEFQQKLDQLLAGDGEASGTRTAARFASSRAAAEAELARIRRRDLGELSFAWAGATAPGAGHYYRIHGLRFAVEYDCTQNDANHVHVVWRDFDRDWGGGALQEHLSRELSR